MVVLQQCDTELCEEGGLQCTMGGSLTLLFPLMTGPGKPEVPICLIFHRKLTKKVFRVVPDVQQHSRIVISVYE